MVQLTWKESFCTGIDHIDNQHRQFFVLFNELDLAVEQRREGGILDVLLSDLDRYVHIHFADEERLMEGIGYPDLPRQRKEHEYFASEIKTQHVRLKSGDVRLGQSTLLFLRDWLTNHILTEDKKYSEFLFAGRPGPGLA